MFQWHSDKCLSLKLQLLSWPDTDSAVQRETRVAEHRQDPVQVIAALRAAGDPNTVQAPNILSGTPLLMLNTDLYGAHGCQQTVSAANGP